MRIRCLPTMQREILLKNTSLYFYRFIVVFNSISEKDNNSYMKTGQIENNDIESSQQGTGHRADIIR